MKNIVKMSLATAMLMGMSSVTAQAEGIDLVDNVKVKGEIRPRYEMSDAGGSSVNANALTNRLRVGVSAHLGGTDWLSGYAEMTDVRALNDNYNDKNDANGIELNQVVVDPEQTRLTQAYLNMKFGETNFKVGRQVINLDGQRFIGAVGWRQMFQTYDAFTLTNKSIKGLDLFASYVTEINRVFDQDVEAGNFAGQRDTRTLLLNASYKVMPELKVTAYSYMIGEGTAGGGSDTHGISLTGKTKVSDSLSLNYALEYAVQDDPTMENSGNPAKETKDASYYNLALGMNMSGFLAGVNYEVLSGDGGGDETAFATPLATGHKFNGWADKFLVTPTAGLEDMSIYVGYKSKKFGLAKVIYHDFKSEVGSTDYGTEVDALYKRGIPGVKNLSGLIKFANYDADANAPTGLNVDSTKFWAMLTYKFSSK
ncbi:alginate export family protein [Sulfurimonas sp.]|nr:alginate export family protein [Sulfurimonas sp.]